MRAVVNCDFINFVLLVLHVLTNIENIFIIF